MATLTLTNNTSEPFVISEISPTQFILAGGETKVIEDLPINILGTAPRLAELFVNGFRVNVSLELTDDERNSAFGQAFQSVAPQAVAPVFSNSPYGVNLHTYDAFSAGGGADVSLATSGSLDRFGDVVRVLDAYLYVETAVGASTCDLRTRAAGAGTVIGTFDTATTGRKAIDMDTLTRLDLSAGDGLYLNRSDAGVEGQIVTVIRGES